jgi:hypothetical protein
VRLFELIDRYLTDPCSTFHKLRYVTKEGYSGNLDRLKVEMGDVDLAELRMPDLKQHHDKWKVGGHIATAHGLATQLRITVGFGATMLEDADCERIHRLFSLMRFETPKKRTTWLTSDQADDVRDEACRQLFLAVALAQAFQFDCALRQKDVIGEWVPADDPEPSSIFSPDGQMKWVRGITREEVNAELALVHKTSKCGKVLTFPLKSCPMVMEEWDFAPPSGPLIIDPRTKLPYEAWAYRRIWRQIATKAGVPKDVWNMDSRAGRITQLLAAGVPIEDARKLAGHEQQRTTSGYSRDTEDAIKRALEIVNGDDGDG